MNNNAEQLMTTNLQHVWNERDAAIRMNIVKDLYLPNSSLFEMGEQIIGFEGINNQVSTLLNSLPSEFVFRQLKPVLINSNLGRLVWGVGPAGKPPVQTGMDIAVFENEKIKSLYVFLDQQN